MSAFKALLRQVEQPHVSITVGHLVSVVADPDTASAIGYQLAGPKACDVAHGFYTLLRDVEMHEAASALSAGHLLRHRLMTVHECFLAPDTVNA